MWIDFRAVVWRTPGSTGARSEMHCIALLSTGQETQNGVTYAKPHITKLRIIISSLPEIES